MSDKPSYKKKTHRSRAPAAGDQRCVVVRQDARHWATSQGHPSLVGAVAVADRADGALCVGRDDPAHRIEGSDRRGAERGARAAVRHRPAADGEKLHNQPAVYDEARTEMLRHCDGKLPPLLDPFSGGVPSRSRRPASGSRLMPVISIPSPSSSTNAISNWPLVGLVGHQSIRTTASGSVVASMERHRWSGGGRALLRTRPRARVEKIGHLYPKVRAS